MWRGPNININRSLEDIDSTSHGWLGFKTSLEEVIADVVNVARTGIRSRAQIQTLTLSLTFDELL